MSDFVLYDEAIPFLHSELPGCPKGMVIQYLREATNDFLRSTYVLQQDLLPINIRDDVFDYELTDLQPDGTEIERIITVSNDETQLQPSAGYVIAPNSKNKIRLTSTPKRDNLQALEIRVALRLSDDATTVSQDVDNWQRVWSDWREAIFAKTLSLLQSQQNKRWTNLVQSAKNLNEYLNIKGRTMREIRKGATNRSLEARGRSRWTL